MSRTALVFAATALLAACGASSPQTNAPTRVIPAPPPMPAAQIPPGGRPADLGTAHASACTLGVFSQVPEQIAGVERVQADDASLTEFPESGGSVRVAGSGRYFRSGDDWEQFRFDCIFDTSAARITRFDVVPL